jgi:hypothetical protein
MHCMQWPVNRTADTWHERTLPSVFNHLHDRLLEKLPVAQLLKKFPTLYRKRVFIIVFTSAHQQALSWLRWIQFTLRPCFSKDKSAHYTTLRRYCVLHTEHRVCTDMRKDDNAWPSTAQLLIYIHSAILRSAHTVYLCVLCGSENKQRLFPNPALNRLVCITETECLLRGTDWTFTHISYELPATEG